MAGAANVEGGKNDKLGPPSPLREQRNSSLLLPPTRKEAQALAGRGRRGAKGHDAKAAPRPAAGRGTGKGGDEERLLRDGV